MQGQFPVVYIRLGLRRTTRRQKQRLAHRPSLTYSITFSWLTSPNTHSTWSLQLTLRKKTKRLGWAFSLRRWTGLFHCDYQILSPFFMQTFLLYSLQSWNLIRRILPWCYSPTPCPCAWLSPQTLYIVLPKRFIPASPLMCGRFGSFGCPATVG